MTGWKERKKLVKISGERNIIKKKEKKISSIYIFVIRMDTERRKRIPEKKEKKELNDIC